MDLDDRAAAIQDSLPDRPITFDEYDDIKTHPDVADAFGIPAGLVNPAAVGSRRIIALALAGENWYVTATYENNPGWTIVTVDTLPHGTAPENWVRTLGLQLRDSLVPTQEQDGWISVESP